VIHERMQHAFAPAGMKEVVQPAGGARFDRHDPVNPDEPAVCLRRQSREMSVRRGYTAHGPAR
jgi:hypothetical protein